MVFRHVENERNIVTGFDKRYRNSIKILYFRSALFNSLIIVLKMAEDFTYQLENQAIAYTKMGTGKPLLVLHGWGSNRQVMLPIAKNLSPLRTCYVIDFPGFGNSPEPDRPWSVNDYADAIVAMITGLNLDQTDVLAHSFGARVTLKLCARKEFQSRIGKILITGGAGMKPHRSASYYFRKYLAKTLKFPFLLLPGSLREKGLNNLRQTKLWKSLGSSDYRSLKGVMRETFVKTVTDYLESFLPLISNEILLLWGTKDETTPLYQAERMDKYLKNSALVTIEGAGHYAFLDQPAKFKLIAEAFFKN